MSVDQLREIVKTTDKEWAKITAQNTLEVVEQWDRGEITDLEEYKKLLVNAASVNTVDAGTADPELRVKIFTLANEIINSAETN